jgi:site-specific DNA-methyltransferase (cytosine-N4-specific)
VTLYQGDALEVLRTLPDESVHCVVTSPPYWGLRDYGTGGWDGGDAECDHRNYPGAATGNKGAVTSTPMQGDCTRCGATRIDQQLGLEPTPEQYVERMVEVFREVRRVLAAHGTVWLNLGDSYGSGTVGRTDKESLAQIPTARGKGGTLIPAGGRNHGGHEGTEGYHRPVVTGLKPKDLVGIPWRVAFALQADGWYLRSDIIWAKPNPMPESVTDRPTKAHEYVFLLSKQAQYFFDQAAVREPAEWARWGDQTVKKPQPGTASWIQPRTKEDLHGEMRVDEPERNLCLREAKGSHGELPHGKNERTGDRRKEGFNARWDQAEVNGSAPTGRNIRSVWKIATQPYPEAHFATFPEELAQRCIAAGCPEMVHGGCGGEDAPCGPDTCRPGIVLDPFMGSGTVAYVARKLGRHAVGIDLSAEYLALASKRLQQQSLLTEIA